jgi:hypothetical protein
MRSTIRVITTFLAIILGVAIPSLRLGPNWLEWIRASGTNYGIRSADAIVDGVAGVTQSSGFIFFGGFFVGGAMLLWVDYFLHRRANIGRNAISSSDKVFSRDLQFQTVTADIDKKNKQVQFSFVFRNVSNQPVRYEVENISVTIDGRTAIHPRSNDRDVVVERASNSSFRFSPISVVLGNNPIEGEASITYKYGVAEDPSFTRKGYCRVFLRMDMSNTVHTILDQTDIAIG